METTSDAAQTVHPAMRPALVLVPGHWLGAWAWKAVTTALEARGYVVTAVTLPGLDPDDPSRASATIEQQADALGVVVAEAGAGGAPVVLVAHSGAGTPVSLLLDRDPTTVARVVYVDSGPTADGAVFLPDVPTDLVEVPLPPFEQLRQGVSLEGLTEDDLDRFRERAVPEPGPVVSGAVTLTNDARRDVPATIICCSFPSAAMMQMACDGHPMMAEVAILRDLQLDDLPTGQSATRPVAFDASGAVVERDLVAVRVGEGERQAEGALDRCGDDGVTAGDERVVDGLDVCGVEPDRGTDAWLNDGCEIGAGDDVAEGERDRLGLEDDGVRRPGRRTDETEVLLVERL